MIEYHRLVLLNDVEPYVRPNGRKERRSMWLCECGNEKEIVFDNVRSGKTKSCGCLNIEKLITRSKTHDMTKSKAYSVYRNMIDRCYRKTNKAYRRYGGRGIKVCDRWLKGFLSFYEDMGDPPTNKYELDRENNNGNYTPENCRWVTRTVNARNSTATKLNTEAVKVIRYILKTHDNPVKLLAKLYKVSKVTIRDIKNNKTWKDVFIEV